MSTTSESSANANADPKPTAPTPTGPASTTILAQESKTEADKTQTQGGEKAKAGTDPSTADKAQGTESAPEPYKPFTFPEGTPVDKALLGKVTPMLQKLGVKQEQAQELITAYATHIAEVDKALIERQFAEEKAKAEAAIKAIKDDPEFGGAKLTESIAAVRKGAQWAGGPELVKLLSEDPAIGNNKILFAALLKVGRAMSDDKSVNGNMGRLKESTIEQLKREYPNSPPEMFFRPGETR